MQPLACHPALHNVSSRRLKRSITGPGPANKTQDGERDAARARPAPPARPGLSRPRGAPGRPTALTSPAPPVSRAAPAVARRRGEHRPVYDRVDRFRTGWPPGGQPQRMKIPRPLINDPGLVSLKTAARAGIVMPAVFAFADQVIGQPQTALYAAFGSLAILVFVSFSGSARSRLLAYLSLAVSGAVLIAVGTACSGNPWLAAGAMLVVGFLILFSGVINGYFAAAGTAAVLVFVLSVTVPAPMSEIGWRLAGWGLASVVGILAVMLIWPPRERASLRADAAQGCLALAALADSVCGDGPAEARRLAAAGESVSGLRGRLTATPHRPTGPTRPTAALAGLIDELGWLLPVTGDPGPVARKASCAWPRTPPRSARSPPCCGPPPGNSTGGRSLSDRDQAGKQPVQRLERARETAAQMLARRVAEQPHIPDEQALQAQVDRGFRVYTISYTARQIATSARAASPHPDGPPIDEVPGPAELAAAASAAAASADAGPDPLTGEVPASRRWTGWMRSWLTRRGRIHRDPRGLPVGLVPQQRPRRGRPGHRGVHRPEIRSPALVLGRAGHPVRTALQRAGHRPVGDQRAGRDGRGHRHRGRDPHPAEGRHHRAVGDSPRRGARGGLRAPGDLVRRRPGRVHRGHRGPVQHHRADRLESRDPADRGRRGRLRDQPGGRAGVLAPRRGRAAPAEPGRGLLTDLGLRGGHGGAAQRAGRRREPEPGRGGRDHGGAPARRLVQPVPGRAVRPAGRPGAGEPHGRRGGQGPARGPVAGRPQRARRRPPGAGPARKPGRRDPGRRPAVGPGPPEPQSAAAAGTAAAAGHPGRHPGERVTQTLRGEPGAERPGLAGLVRDARRFGRQRHRGAPARAP